MYRNKYELSVIYKLLELSKFDSVKQMETVFSDSKNIVVFSQLNGNICFVNEAAKQFVSIGDDFKYFFEVPNNDNSPDSFYDEVYNNLLITKFLNKTVKINTSDGNVKVLNSNIFLKQILKTIYIIGVFVDITNESLENSVDFEINYTDFGKNVIKKSDKIDNIKYSEIKDNPETSKNNSPNDDIIKILSNVNVLLVDDSLITNSILGQSLENEGAEITIAADGLEALQKFKQHHFDIVLIDINMPNINGYEISKEITVIKNIKGVDTSIIGITENTELSDYNKCIESGMADLIIKPFKLYMLLRVITKALYGEDYNKKHKISKSFKSKYMLEKIAGIDYIDGIVRLGGNEELYHEMLVKFKKDNENLIGDIKHLISLNKIDDVLSLLFKLKGVSGMLSMNSVYSNAKRTIELFNNNFYSQASNTIHLLEESLNEVFNSLSQVESAFLMEYDNFEEIDMLHIHSLLKDLMTYISWDIDLYNAKITAEELADFMKYSKYTDDFSEIIFEISKFNMQKASSLLSEFIIHFGKGGK